MNIPTLNGNWVDLLIFLILGLYVLEGIKRGFWVLIAELISFVGSLLSALRFYPLAAQFLNSNFSLPRSFANALGFLSIAILAEIILSLFLTRALRYIPKSWWGKPWEKVLGIIPAILDGLILIAFIATLFVALPVGPRIKTSITDSKIGGYLVRQTVQLERQLATIFGGALRDTLTLFTIEPNSRERVQLPFTPQQLELDEASERQMFELVNQERRKRGIRELEWDQKIVLVARDHSRDMWERHYFAHVSPDGKDPGDRLQDGGVSYRLAGENIALAPTTELAHQGLMNSEGHRRNILDPRFRKIGIGVIDGGIYGKMFTQNFTD